MAKTTMTDTMYHKCFAVKVTTVLKDAMKAENWVPELWVCCRPPQILC